MNKEEFEKVNVFGLGNPNDAFAYFIRGNIKKTLNKNDEAEKDFEKYEELKKEI